VKNKNEITNKQKDEDEITNEKKKKSNEPKHQLEIGDCISVLIKKEHFFLVIEAFSLDDVDQIKVVDSQYKIVNKKKIENDLKWNDNVISLKTTVTKWSRDLSKKIKTQLFKNYKLNYFNNEIQKILLQIGENKRKTITTTILTSNQQKKLKDNYTW
jgi:hypothetical protein